MAPSIFRAAVALAPLLTMSTALDAWYYDNNNCDWENKAVNAIKADYRGDDFTCYNVGASTADPNDCLFYNDANWSEDSDPASQQCDADTADSFEARSLEIQTETTPPGTVCYTFGTADCVGAAAEVVSGKKDCDTPGLDWWEPTDPLYFFKSFRCLPASEAPSFNRSSSA